MNIDGQRLRARRLQLGLTTRGLARTTRVSQTLIKRLEESGDASTITCGTMRRILDALSLDLVDLALRPVDSSVRDTGKIELLGAILAGRKSGIAPSALAQLAGVEPFRLNEHLGVLEQTLRPGGVRLHRGSTGLRLVPAETSPLPATGSRSTNTLTDADLRMLYRAHQGRLHTREVAAMKTGNVSLHRLTLAGLAAIGRDGTVTIAATVNEALDVEQA